MQYEHGLFCLFGEIEHEELWIALRHVDNMQLEVVCLFLSQATSFLRTSDWKSLKSFSWDLSMITDQEPENRLLVLVTLGKKSCL